MYHDRFGRPQSIILNVVSYLIRYVAFLGFFFYNFILILLSDDFNMNPYNLILKFM